MYTARKNQRKAVKKSSGKLWETTEERRTTVGTNEKATRNWGNRRKANGEPRKLKKFAGPFAQGVLDPEHEGKRNKDEGKKV